MKCITTLTVIVIIGILVSASLALADVPHQMHYQGQLTDDLGAPLDTVVSMTFTIYNDSSGGTVLWSETQTGVEVSEGLFNVLMGSVTPIPDTVFADDWRWLGITIGSDPEIDPRTKMVAVPFAFRVATVDGSTGGTISGDVAIQSDLDLDGDLRVTGKARIGPGVGNVGTSAFAAGEDNQADGAWSTVSGGLGNTANGEYAAVGGGSSNIADSSLSTVGGGRSNRTTGWCGTIGGGDHNLISGGIGPSTIGGGSYNTAGDYSTIGGGYNNTASGYNSTVSGGQANFVEALYSSILGGYGDTITATGDYSYLFGMGSKLTEDSTFMVDMPHIRFGDETDGYEFPDADGAAGQVMQTDGSGQLSWANVSGGGGGGWADDGDVVRLETSTDSVGIGTTTPTEKLDVEGNIHASGTITSGSSITIDGASDMITATSGTIDFDDENLVTAGKATIGLNNVNTGTGAFVAGHYNNARGDYSVVSGGGGEAAYDSNSALGNYSTVGGGQDNVANSIRSTVGGGWRNEATGTAATIGGGDKNTTNGGGATVGGGGFNVASAAYATVGGGHHDTASAQYATVSGGYYNSARSDYATVAGGRNNSADGWWSTVSGGRYNFAGGSDVVCGGYADTANGGHCSIGGGELNKATNFFCTVAGGRQNTASGERSTVSGGADNTASDRYSTIGGGFANTVGGQYATVPGGWRCAAGGDYSFAAGNTARADHDGSVVLSANSYAWDTVSTGGIEQMVLRADGGLYITNTAEQAPYDNTNLITTRGGAYLSGNGTNWTNSSDKNAKENFTEVDRAELLERLAILPITRWNYRTEGDNVVHIGPTAQDFYTIFRLGKDDKSISTIDPAGVALAVVQELHRSQQELKEKTKEIDELRKQLQETNAQLGELSTLVQTILAKQNSSKSGEEKLAINH